MELTTKKGQNSVRIRTNFLRTLMSGPQGNTQDFVGMVKEGVSISKIIVCAQLIKKYLEGGVREI